MSKLHLPFIWVTLGWEGFALRLMSVLSLSMLLVACQSGVPSRVSLKAQPGPASPVPVRPDAGLQPPSSPLLPGAGAALVGNDGLGVREPNPNQLIGNDGAGAISAQGIASMADDGDAAASGAAPPPSVGLAVKPQAGPPVKQSSLAN